MSGDRVSSAQPVEPNLSEVQTGLFVTFLGILKQTFWRVRSTGLELEIHI